MGRKKNLDAFADEVLADLHIKSAPTLAEYEHQSKMLAAKSARSSHWATIGKGLRKYRKTEDGLLEIVSEISSALVKSLPRHIRRHIRKNVKIRCANTDDAFGLFVNDIDGEYSVIVISTGLMILLNKLLKFEQAEHDITQVIYCNRYEISDLTPALIRKMRAEVIDQYKKHDSKGPSIYLEKDFHVFQLLTQEAFIIAHEIAHFIDKTLICDSITKLFMEKNLNISEAHASEYAADALGLFILFHSDFFARYMPSSKQSKREKTSERNICKDILCACICHFFENLELAGHQESKSHPSPFNRALSVLRWIFGEETVKAYLRWMNKLGPYPNWVAIDIDFSGQEQIRRLIIPEDNTHYRF